MDDLILILDDDDLELSVDYVDTVFVDDVPHAAHYDEYTGDYEVNPSLEQDIELSTAGKLMTDDLVVKAVQTTAAEAEITGTNTVTPMVSVSGQNITLGNTDTGISVTALGGGIASASATATATVTGFVESGTVMDTATLASESASTSTTLFIQSVVVPTGKTINVSTESGASVTVTNGGFLSAGLSGEIAIDGHTLVTGSAWVTSTPTATGTYYGKTVIDSSILQIAYPVGSLYATETSTDDPATILGFGTWTKYAPADMTWNDTELSWNTSIGTTEGIYVWKRTA